MKLPWFQFYPADWLKDPSVRRCGHAAKGVWIDMLCLMFECDERGVLASADTPWTDEEIAGAIGGNGDVTLAAINELVAKGVVRRRKDGALFCSRMVKDAENRLKTAKRVQKHRSNGVCNGYVTPPVTGLVTPSYQVEDRRQKTEDRNTAPPTPNTARLPTSMGQAVSFAAGSGVPDSFAKEVFLEHDGTSWTYAGKPVTNWKSYLSSRWMKVRDIQTSREKNGKGFVQSTPTSITADVARFRRIISGDECLTPVAVRAYVDSCRRAFGSLSESEQIQLKKLMKENQL